MRQTFPIVAAALLVFAVVASVMIRFMPEPIEDTDYLIAGSVATLVAILVLFLGTVSTRKSSDVFVKKRKKQRP